MSEESKAFLRASSDICYELRKMRELLQKIILFDKREDFSTKSYETQDFSTQVKHLEDLVNKEKEE